MSHQRNVADYLIKNGVAMGLGDLLRGLFIGATPFPRPALTAHTQLMGNGTMMTGLGLVLRETDLLHNSRRQALVIYGLNLGWIPRLSECFNAEWGANQVLPIVAKEASAIGALTWQETIVTIAHKGSSFFFIPAMGIIAWELLFGKRHARHDKHDKHGKRD